jgi:hypothetical protein
MDGKKIIIILIGPFLAGCAMTSDVMDAGNGTYIISGRASPVRGGATGAIQVAYKDANAFCAKKGGHAVVLDSNNRDVYQSSIGGSWGAGSGSFVGGTFAAGNAELRFRCV